MKRMSWMMNLHRKKLEVNSNSEVSGMDNNREDLALAVVVE
jgi:hypothetical protein